MSIPARSMAEIGSGNCSGCISDSMLSFDEVCDFCFGLNLMLEKDEAVESDEVATYIGTSPFIMLTSDM